MRTGRCRPVAAFVTSSVAIWIKPMIRIVHGKLDTRPNFSLDGDNNHRIVGTYPTSGINFRAAIGKITPPQLEPTPTSPKAIPFFVVNHWDITLTIGPMMNPHESYNDGVTE